MVDKVENRVPEEILNKKRKIEKLKRDLTPSFTPRINKRSANILKNSPRKKDKSRNQDLYTQFDSLDKISSLIHNRSKVDEDEIGLTEDPFRKRMKIITQSTSEMRGLEYITKDQTYETLSSANFGTVSKQDDFKNFLDSYEKNLK